METIETSAPVTASVSIAPITRDFYWDEESPTHDIGWHPSTMPQFDPGSAFHVAHDTMEHLDQHDPSFEAEMKAFGAHLYLRGVTDYWPMKQKWTRAIEEKEAKESNDPLEQLLLSLAHSGPDRRSAAEHLIGDLFTFLEQDERMLKPPAIDAKAMPTQAERVLAETERIARRKMQQYDVSGKKNEARQEWDERIARAEDWIRIGYAEEAARLPGISEHTRASAFLAIETAVNAVTLPPGPLQQGDPLRITVDFDKRRVIADVAGKERQRAEVVPF